MRAASGRIHRKRTKHRLAQIVAQDACVGRQKEWLIRTMPDYAG